MDVPKYAEYAITRYKINREDLYGHVSKEARYDMLESEYDMQSSVEMKGGIRDMCNLSERIEQKGIEQGIEQSLYSLVKKGLLKVEDAAKEMNVPVEEFAAKMEKASY